MHSRDHHLIARLCKAYVVQQTQLNPRAFTRTHDQAWITVAARLLRQRQSLGLPKLVSYPHTKQVPSK
jgi:hypothetical protein